MKRLALFVLLTSPLSAARVHAQSPSCTGACVGDGSIYLAFYWKARAGKETEYEEYIRGVAKPIDDEAERAGAFLELRTYLPEKPNGEWTHLRVFRFKDQAQLDVFSAAMDEAGKRLYPDASKKPKADELRDLVKRETWRAFQ